MIVPGPELKIYIATRPVDFRCGHDGLAAKVQEMFGLSPFSGAAFVFRSRRAHFPTFDIRFATRHDRVSVASAFRGGVAGRAFPPWKATKADHHRSIAGLFTRGAAVDVRR